MKIPYLVPSLSKDFALVAFSIILLMFSYMGWRIYTLQVETIKERLTAQEKRVERTLIDHFDYTEHMMIYMAHQISENGAGNNIKFIYDLLHSFKTDPKVDNLLSWSTFMWNNKEHQIIVEGVKGILETPRDLSRREYIPKTVASPHKLFLGQPAYGAMSAQWVIPGGVGAVDKKGKYIGGISMGFNIAKLVAKLDYAINAPGVTFGLFDEDCILIGQTPRSDFSIINKALIEKLKNNVPFANSGLLYKSSLFGEDKGFVFYQALTKYPYILVLKYDKSMSDHELWKAMFFRITEFVLIAIIIIITLFFLYRRIITPVVQLANTADEIAQGNYSLRASYKGNGEVGKLTNAFNGMLEQIENAKNSLEKKVIERTSELQKALQAKTEFLNNVNHELRTPVHGVMNFSDILVTDWDQYDDKMRLKLAADIYNSSERLHSLVTNLLDLSKYKEGKMIITPVEADLTSVVAAVMHDCRPLYLNKKDITLVLENPDVPMKGAFDKDRIMQVVRNLVSNAIKYSNSGTVTARISRVEFKLGRKKRTGLQFSLSDEGKGVPENELEDIFSPFTQSTRTRTGAGGTGLGLSISKEIIEGHQGKIWAECRPDNKGMVFSFIIPV
jgi:two-component system, sensor histidine kinase ChiS